MARAGLPFLRFMKLRRLGYSDNRLSKASLSIRQKSDGFYLPNINLDSSTSLSRINRKKDLCCLPYKDSFDAAERARPQGD